MTLWPADQPQEKLLDAIEGLGAFMKGPAYTVLEGPDLRDPDTEGEEDDIWSVDLRPSEARALYAAFQAGVDKALERALEVILDELTAAGLAFAAEYPDAPRAKVAR